MTDGMQIEALKQIIQEETEAIDKLKREKSETRQKDTLSPKGDSQLPTKTR